MGKLNYNPYIKHFSHEHPLELSNIQSTKSILSSTYCSGCKQKPSSSSDDDQWIYTCKTCNNYILHISCSQMPQLINHPSHPNHPLSLLPSPPYPEGFFNCDACNRQGHGFCYHCTACNFDIHISCASLPLALNHHSHHHPLNLTFHLPYQTKGFSCDICRNLGSNNWIYRCNLCEFDAHLDCARTTSSMATNQTASAVIQQSQPAIPFQHHHSFPGANIQLQSQLPVFQLHNSFPGAGVNQPPPRVNNNNATHQQPNYYYVNSGPNNVGHVMQSSSTVRPVQSNPPPPPNFYANNNNNTVMGMAIQGFVEQIGQNFVQSMVGSSSGGNNGGTSTNTDFAGGFINGDSSISDLDMGSSVMGEMFGDPTSFI